jgi:hypothetical protein
MPNFGSSTWSLTGPIWFAVQVQRRPYCATQVPFCQGRGGNLWRSNVPRNCWIKSVMPSASRAVAGQCKHYSYRTEQAYVGWIRSAPSGQTLHLLPRRAPSIRNGRSRGRSFSHPPRGQGKRRCLGAEPPALSSAEGKPSVSSCSSTARYSTRIWAPWTPCAPNVPNGRLRS